MFPRHYMHSDIFIRTFNHTQVCYPLKGFSGGHDCVCSLTTILDALFKRLGRMHVLWVGESTINLHESQENASLLCINRPLMVLFLTCEFWEFPGQNNTIDGGNEKYQLI